VIIQQFRKIIKISFSFFVLPDLCSPHPPQHSLHQTRRPRDFESPIAFPMGLSSLVTQQLEHQHCYIYISIYKFGLYRCKSLRDVPLSCYIMLSSIFHSICCSVASRLDNVCVFWIPRLPRSPAVCRVAHGRRCPIREALYPNWARRCCAG
jgi:hypothetical protein